MPKTYKIDEQYLPPGWTVGWIVKSPDRRKQFEILDVGGPGGVTLRKLSLSEQLNNRLVMGDLEAWPVLEELEKTRGKRM
jgi:hypothetical protein